jgi:hypothetical protein
MTTRRHSTALGGSGKNVSLSRDALDITEGLKKINERLGENWVALNIKKLEIGYKNIE